MKPILAGSSCKTDGHLAGPPIIIALENDEATANRAKQILNGQVIEVWQGKRVVSRLDPSRG